MLEIVIPLGIIFFYFSFLFYENREHQKNLDSLYRIHINGIRGKTTVTRMIGTVLYNSGFRVLTKTTGSEPKIILPNGKQESIIRPMGAKISEQIKIVKRAVSENATHLVVECMAIEPHTQKMLEEYIIKSHIGVITNIRYDHQDVMGDKLEDIAKSISNTIPTNGKLVIMNDISHKELLIDEANKKNTEVFECETKDISEDFIKKFDFLNFKENVALALKVAELIGVDKELALSSMLKTIHDIGQTKIYNRFYDNKNLTFINTFSNNDVPSMEIVMKNIGGLKGKTKIAILNHREDRIFRSLSFIEFIIKNRFEKVLITGDLDKKIQDELLNQGFIGDIYMSNRKIEKLLEISDNKSVWFGIANIKGCEDILEFFEVT